MNIQVKNWKAKSPSIDELPSDALDSILVRLPIRDAVRTSILSRQRRYRWTTMTQLEFIKTETGRIDEFSSEVNHVLMFHFGPIHKFKVSVELTRDSEVDRSTDYRSMDDPFGRNSIKELVLKLHRKKEYYYVMHSSLFSCQGISILRLFGCTLKLPPVFKVFSHLSSLHLQDCKLSDGCLQNLISMCPNLQSLVLINNFRSDYLRINCPRLEHLFLCGLVQNFSLVNTPALSVLRIEFENQITFHLPVYSITCNINRIFSCASSIEKLELLKFCAAYLAFGFKPNMFPVFEQLKSLRLSTNFLEREQVSLLSLLSASCYLQELTLENFPYEANHIGDKKGWKTKGDINVLNHLLTVKIIGVKFMELEMEIIKFLLVHAPVLQRMEIIMHAGWDCSTEVFIQLLQLKRASSQAEVVLVR